MLPCLEDNAHGVLLRVLIQPRAGRDQLVGLHQDRLKIRLSAPPVDGAANRQCCRYLAQCLGLAKSQVSLHSGSRSRRKTLLLSEVTLERISRRLETALSP